MRSLVALALLASVGAADPAVHVPKAAPIVVRVASLDRLDAIAREWVPLLEDFGAADLALVLKEVDLSAVLFHQAGLSRESVAADRPVFVGLMPLRKEFVVAGTARGDWTGERVLPRDYVAVRRGDAFVVGCRAVLGEPARGAATPFLEGDLAVHVRLGELAERRKDVIEHAFALAALNGTAQLPESLRPLALPLVSAAKKAVFGVESLTYALRWDEGRMAAEGLLETCEDSALRALLRRAGPPRDNPLVGYLPPDAFLAFDCSAAAGWPSTELAGLLDVAFGEGAGVGLVQVFNLSAPIARHLTGRFAGSMSVIGLGGGTVGIAELKKDVDAKALLKAYDVEAANRALAALKAPVTLRLERNVADHGGTAIHRVELKTPVPELQFFAGMVRICIAAEGRYFFAVMAPTAEADLRDLLDQVRAGKTVRHPHARAMARLGPTRSFGFTLNVAALRQLGMMLGMTNPKAAEAATRIPDDFILSTAVVVEDGNLRWKGDWSVREMAALAAALRGETD